jgi:hypothetical protein
LSLTAKVLRLTRRALIRNDAALSRIVADQ